MLSVLVVSPSPAVPGGVSVFIETMKRHVAQSRIDSFFVGSAGGGHESFLCVFKRLFGAPLRLARLVRKNKYDVVHLNPSFDVKSLVRDGLLLLALRAIGFRRVLVFFHGWDFELQRCILKSPLWRHKLGWILNQAALVTVLGEDFRKGLIAGGVEASRIIVTRTMYEAQGLEAVRGEPVTATRRFILFMSRFDREKGARELLQGFAALAQDYPDLDLVLAGSGEDEERLRAQAPVLGVAGRVRFPGYVTGADKWRLLRDCVIFALPSYYRGEGMPVAVLEAMGAGKPLLAGSAGVLRHLAVDGENGVVLRAIEARTVEAGLRRLLDDTAFAARAGAHNAGIAQTRYEARQVTQGIEEFYRQVAGC